MHRELWCLKEKICIFKYGWDRMEKVILTEIHSYCAKIML